MSKALRLELAQYNELLSFAQFGTELDEISQRHLNRGAVAVEILKQEQFVHYSFIDEAIILFMLRQDLLDTIPLKEISSFVVKCTSYVQSVYPEMYQEIAKTTDISDSVAAKLKLATAEFAQLFKVEQA